MVPTPNEPCPAPAHLRASRALWLGRVLSGPDFSAADREEEPTKGRCRRGPSEMRVAGEGAWEKEAKVSPLVEGDGPQLVRGPGKER